MKQGAMMAMRSELTQLRAALEQARKVVEVKDRQAAIATQVACVLMRRAGKDRLHLHESDLHDALLYCGMRMNVGFQPSEPPGGANTCVVTLPPLTEDERRAQQDAIDAAKAAGASPAPPAPEPKAPTLRIYRGDGSPV